MSLSSASSLFALTDDLAIQTWLNRTGARSQETLRSYKMQVSRLRAFLAMDSGQLHNPRLILDATSEQISRFIHWLEGDGREMPTEVASHFGLNSRRAIKPAGGSSVLGQAMVILNSMYEDFEVLKASHPAEISNTGNPFVPFRHRFKRPRSLDPKQAPASSPRTERVMSDDAFSALCEYAEYLDGLSTADRKMLRARMMFLCFVSLWERSSAIASLTWADFKRDAQGVWMIRRDRKSKGPVWAPAPLSIVSELIQWRTLVDLPYQVTPEELAKSVFWMGKLSAGHDGPLDERTARRVISGYIHAAAEHFRLANPEIAKELGAQRLNPRVLRLTVAAKFVAGGGNPMSARRVLGQKTLSPIIEDLVPFDEQRYLAAMEKHYLAMVGSG